MERPTTRRLERLVLAFFVLASAADALTTWAGLRAGHTEANPVAATLFTHVGVAGTLLLRVVAPALLIGALIRFVRSEPALRRVALAAVALVAVGWLVVATRNVMM